MFGDGSITDINSIIKGDERSKRYPMKLHYIKQYDALIKTLLFGKTCFRANLHLTPSGLASIGYNFNLQDEFVFSRVLEALRFDQHGRILAGEALNAECDYLGLLRSALSQCHHTDLDSLLLEVQDVLTARLADDRYQRYQNFHRVEHFSIPNSEKATAICYAIIGQYEKVVDDWITAFDFDILKTNSHLLSRNSTERAVLVSLAAQTIIGFDKQGKPLNLALAKALIDDDRAEAWYTIRYATFDSAVPDKTVVKQRYFESELFNLYEDGIHAGNINRDVCKDLYAMYNLHKDQVLHFERDFRYLVSEANAELNLKGARQIKTLEQSFSIAYNHIRNAPYLAESHNRYVASMEQGMEEFIQLWARNDDLDYEIAATG